MWFIVTDRVAWSVGLSVCHTSEPCKNGRVVGLRNRVRWGPEVLRDVAMAIDFGMQFAITGFMGYNFGCMIASNTLFDSRVGFSRSSYPMKTLPISRF